MIRPARDFDGMIQLLGLAGRRLREGGLALPQRLKTLRGLYYGSSFSLDFERRRSRLRNLGFNFYLQSRPPRDPTVLLGADLVRALKDSAVIRDGRRSMDVGHLIIGLAARQRRVTRHWRIPGQGGSGLELATWLGDLGGAAGLLALARLDAPATRARDLLFSPEGYDLRPNLEGDMAAYLVACADDGARGAAPLGRLDTVAEGLQDYLDRDWDRRFRRFVPRLGATPREGGGIGSDAWRRALGGKIFTFGSSYTLFRLWQEDRLRRPTVAAAARRLEGAAVELGAIFVDWLETGMRGETGAAALDPEPSPPGNTRGLLRWISPWCRQESEADFNEKDRKIL